MSKPAKDSPTNRVTLVDERKNALRSVTRDGSVHRALEHRIRRLVQDFGLTPDDLDELRQDLWLEITSAFERYRPEKSAPGTYARRVADRWSCQQARRLSSPKSIRERATRNRNPVPSSRAESHLDAMSARLDAEAVLSGLPDEDVNLLWASLSLNKVQMGRQFGIHRGNVYRRLDRIRGTLKTRFPGMTKVFCELRATDLSLQADR